MGPRPSKGDIHCLGRSPTRDVEQQTSSFSTLVVHLSLNDTTVRDLHFGRRTSATRARELGRFDNIHALDDLAENDMFAIEPRNVLAWRLYPSRLLGGLWGSWHGKE